jgi:hypothetical protein
MQGRLPAILRELGGGRRGPRRAARDARRGRRQGALKAGRRGVCQPRLQDLVGCLQREERFVYRPPVRGRRVAERHLHELLPRRRRRRVRTPPGAVGKQVRCQDSGVDAGRPQVGDGRVGRGGDRRVGVRFSDVREALERVPRRRGAAGARGPLHRVHGSPHEGFQLLGLHFFCSGQDVRSEGLKLRI